MGLWLQAREMPMTGLQGSSSSPGRLFDCRVGLLEGTRQLQSLENQLSE